MLDLFNNKNIVLRSRVIRKRLKKADIILWLIPILMVFVSSILIASIQRQIDYVNWHQHLLAGVVGLLFAVVLAEVPVSKIRPYLVPLYIITVLVNIRSNAYGLK